MLKIIRFGIVGGFSFVFEISVLYLLYNVMGINAVMASTIAFAISLIVNYYGSVKFVFNVNNNMGTISNFTFFIAMGVVGLFLNALIIYIGVNIFVKNIYVCKVMSTIIITIINYFAKLWFLEGAKDESIRA